MQRAKDHFPPRRHDMQVLAGLLQYAVGNALGATLRMAARLCSAMAAGHYPKEEKQYKKLCDWICEHLRKVKPRSIDLTLPRSPLLVYTDASWEAPNSGWGAVIIDMVSNCNVVFNGVVPQMLVDHWLISVGKQIICQAEMFAAVVARWYFSQQFRGRRAIFWIDNDAIRLALIKTVSLSPELLVMSQCFHTYSEQDGIACWFERVPSDSNIADGPSRGCLQEAAQLVNGRILHDVQLPTNVLESFVNDEMYEAFSSLSKIVPLPKHDLIRGWLGSCISLKPSGVYKPKPKDVFTVLTPDILANLATKGTINQR